MLDTKVSEKISTIICNKYFCADIKKMSPIYQTSKCEAFHSLIINFAPKSTAFTFHGMLSSVIDTYVMLIVFYLVGCVYQCCITMRTTGGNMQKLRRERKNALFRIPSPNVEDTLSEM